MGSFLTKRRVAWIVSLAILALILYIILPVSIPLIMALITAILLEPGVKLMMTRFGLKRKFAVLTVFILFVIVVGFTGYFGITKVASEALASANRFPGYVNKLSSYWDEMKDNIALASRDLPDAYVNEMTGQVEKFINSVKSVLLNYVNIGNIRTFLTKIPELFISFIVYLVALFLFMADIPRMRNSINKHLTDRTADKVNLMFFRLSYVILGFLKAQLLVSVLIFAISLLGLYLIAPDVAVSLALLIWVLDFIPVVGLLLVLGPWALFHVLAGNLLLALELAILSAVLLAVRHILEPRMLGNQFRMSPLATLAAIYLGFKILGVSGIVIGPIITIAVYSAKEAGILKFNFKI